MYAMAYYKWGFDCKEYSDFPKSTFLISLTRLISENEILYP